MTLQERKQKLEAELAEVNRQLEGYSRELPPSGRHWFIEGDGNGGLGVEESRVVTFTQLECGNAFATEEEAQRHLEMILDILNPRKLEDGWMWNSNQGIALDVERNRHASYLDYWFCYNTSGIWATKEEAEANGPAWAARWCQK